jgi:hypothetical protein
MCLLPLGNPLQKSCYYIPPLPTTLSPPFLKGGEGRGEGELYIDVPCPLGALRVTLYQILAKGF